MVTRRPLRLLQLVSTLNVGGAEQIVLNLAERVNARQFETHVCSLSRIGKQSLQPAFEKLGVPLLALDSQHFYSLKTLRTVEKYIRTQKIDLIHTHLTDADIVGRVLGRYLKIPVLSTMHNMPHNYARQRVDRYWLERLTARYWATHLVAVSPNIREMYVSEWHIPPRKISAINNSVQMESFLAVGEGVLAEREFPGPVITNVARFNPQKAQHILLAAAALVIEKVPTAHFLMVGKGHLEKPLRQQAQDLGIADNVIFTGVRHDIPHVLAQSDIFALSSLWEGVPLSVIEAMAAARPVVVTAVGGNVELVESGLSGLVVPPDSAPALAEAFLTLLRDEERRLALGRSARQRVQHLFSPEQFIQQYELLYRRLGSGEAAPVVEGFRPVGERPL
ncbi:MAG: glycosyltransferase [Chloroflexi bacterium]|nr:glycosyltransferase [Chloroflexota bacterium]